MSNVVESNINVAGVIVKQDQEGRYCLNDLHKASGGARNDQPAFFMRRPETTELVDEITRSANMQSLEPVNRVVGKGKAQGTYVVKELVYAYAMWISASFHLKVIRAYDQMVTQPAQPKIPDFSNPAEAARAWAEEYEHKQKALEQVQAQQAQLEEARPSVEFVESYVNSGTGTKGFRQVAKLLNANERLFRKFLKDSKIMYKLGGEWIPYQYYIDQEYFTVRTGTSGEHVYNQSRFTPKGIKWVAGKWAQHNIESSL